MEKIIRKYVLNNAYKFGKALLKPIIPKVLGEYPQAKNNIKDLIKKINKEIKKVNKLSKKEILNELEKIAPELLEEKEKEDLLKDLPNNNKVIMRIAPFPSGALHIGNVRGMIINDEYVKKYNGKLLLIIDDTIGSIEKPIVPEAYKLIPEALSWLGINFQKIIYKSDRLSLYYKYGEELIKKGYAYACECPSKTIKEFREKKKECQHRKRSINENLKIWKEMLKGKYKEGEIAIRLKTSMKDKDPAFRDRVLFRISERTHPRVGNKYKVWPMLEMSWAVDDMVLGITHIIRGKELMIEGRMENFIWDILGYQKKPFIKLIGLLQIKGVKISKSKSRKEVETGVYTGWDDPRTWSVQSLKRRGFKPRAIRDFILSLGISKAEIKVPIDSLYTINRRLIDNNSLRYFFVKDPIKLIVKNCPEKKIKLPMHPKKKEYRTYVIEKGTNEFMISKSDIPLLKKEGKVRLKDAINIEINKVGNIIQATCSKEQTEVYNIKKLQFIIKGKQCNVIMPNGDIDKGLCEQYCSRIKIGDIIQFERYGFVRKEGDGKYIYTHP